jgi:hypothetical protein
MINRRKMSIEKKKMVNKTFSRPTLHSQITRSSMLGQVMMNECGQTTGIGEFHPFLRKNTHSGPIPWTDSLRRARPRRGNPQYFVRQHRGMVKQLWRVTPVDTKAHRPTAKIAKNNPKHRTNPMFKCLSAHLHTTSYLARFLAKPRNRFKRTGIGAYATAETEPRRISA